jgi:hypothetical protein
LDKTMKLLAFVLLLLAIPISSGQVAKKPSKTQKELDLGVATFTLCGGAVTVGQSQDEVLKVVTPTCSISPLPAGKDAPPGDSLWALETAHHGSLPGSLVFNSGRLVGVQKDWTEGRPDTSHGYAESIYDAFMSVDGKPTGLKANCTISLALELDSSTRADILDRYVILSCKDIHLVQHTYNVRLMQLPKANFAQFKDYVR